MPTMFSATRIASKAPTQPSFHAPLALEVVRNLNASTMSSHYACAARLALMPVKSARDWGCRGNSAHRRCTDGAPRRNERILGS